MRTSLAMILFAISAAAGAQQLGTLFHTPQEREALDRMRRGERVGQAGQADVVRPDPVVTGYVKRSDGKSTVFLDKQPYPSRDESVQRLLEPQVIERFEPLAPPPEAPVENGEAKAAAKAPAPKAPQGARPKGGKEE